MVEPSDDPIQESRVRHRSRHIGRWRHVVVGTPMLVVGDQQERTLEHRRVASQGFVDCGDQRLSPGEITSLVSRATVVGLVRYQVVAGMLAVTDVGSVLAPSSIKWTGGR
jgi:hypothetical protein